jgi:acid phosphatase
MAALVILLLTAGCTTRPTSQPSVPSPTSANPTSANPGGAAPTSAAPSVTQASRPDHVVVVIFENKSYAQVAGDSRARYLHSLMERGALFTDFHAITHPSQPNYIALFSGSTQGVTDNRCPVRLGNKPNLGRQLLDAGFGFAGYSEDLPGPGYTGCSAGGYAAKHNPWVDFDNLPIEANQPFTAFPTDFARLPTVGFVVPNLCHSMHDCPVSTGDEWLRQHLDRYLTWAYANNSRLVVTFDEDDGSRDNHILTLVAGAGVPSRRYGHRVTLYSLLAAIEEWYGLPPLGEAARAVRLW